MSFSFGSTAGGAGFGANSVPQFGVPPVSFGAGGMQFGGANSGPQFGAVGTPYPSQLAAVPFVAGGVHVGAAGRADDDAEYVCLARDPVSKLCACHLLDFASSSLFLTLCACMGFHTWIP